jgi:hypothetical protein
MAVDPEVHALLDRLHASVDEFAEAFDDPYRRGVAHQRMRDLVDELERVTRAGEGDEIDLRDAPARTL